MTTHDAGRVSLQEAVSTEAEGVTDEVFANTVSTKQAAMEALDLEEPFLAFYCDTYLVPLPPKHRFPMLK